jgi:RNA polymerase subunit RPABC4/transcription elongation factor Spt4
MPRGLDTIIQLLVAVMGAYLAAFWFCLVVWTFRDVQKRTHDVVVQVLATMLVMLFNLPGLLLYSILRPPETLAEVYARNLEEESLMQEVQERMACPNCKYRVEPEYKVCPACGTDLKRSCPNCSKLMNLSWDVCPYCGHHSGAHEHEAEGQLQ